MKIFMACPAPPGSRKGNRVTASRWSGFLKSLGHRVTITQDWDGKPYDVLIALHARKSSEAVHSFRRAYPDGRIVVVLTGTDVYRDLKTSKKAQRSLELADRIVVLQPKALEELTPAQRKKGYVIIQSAEPTPASVRRFPFAPGLFPVCVLGHLRSVKDPFRAAMATRFLPSNSQMWVIQAGEALTSAMQSRAQTLTERLPRYQWIGNVSARQARLILASCQLMVISSRLEGGANVVSEALADGIPILASRMPGNIGLLGARYPGYFPVGDTEALAKLLSRAETDAGFYQRLKDWCMNLAPMVKPDRECARWAQLLDELVP